MDQRLGILKLILILYPNIRMLNCQFLLESGLLLLFFVPRGTLLESHRCCITTQGSEFIIKAVLALLNCSLGMQHPYSKAVVKRVHLNMNFVWKMYVHMFYA